jgi:hypothetical protein
MPRGFLLENATMTKLTIKPSDLPANSVDTTTSDRVTHRKWAYGWFIAYSVLIGSLVTFSIATRPERGQPDDRHGAGRAIRSNDVQSSRQNTYSAVYGTLR